MKRTLATLATLGTILGGTAAPAAAGMSDPTMGEITMVGFTFCPRGWAETNGQLLPINQNQALFSLLGTTYGGDGRTTFALPDLRGRVPLHPGTGPGLSQYTQGQKMGVESVTLSVNNLPPHTHAVTGNIRAAAGAGTSPNPAGASLAISPNAQIYAPGGASVDMGGESVTGVAAATGNGQSVTNIQPMIGIRFCIALNGMFPSRN